MKKITRMKLLSMQKLEKLLEQYVKEWMDYYPAREAGDSVLDSIKSTIKDFESIG